MGSNWCFSCPLGSVQKNWGELPWPFQSNIGHFFQNFQDIVVILAIIYKFTSTVDFEVFLIHAKTRCYLFKSFEKVTFGDWNSCLYLKLLWKVHQVVALRHSKGGCILNDRFKLSSSIVFSQMSYFSNIHIFSKKMFLIKLPCVNFQNLISPFFIRNTDLYVNFKSSRPENSLVKKVFSICHSNHYHIVQGLHTIQICQ